MLLRVLHFVEFKGVLQHIVQQRTKFPTRQDLLINPNELDYVMLYCAPFGFLAHTRRSPPHVGLLRL
jgi:hypothetical protein